MEFNITKKPKGCVLIIGFPSTGLVSTITGKYLIEHLDTEVIGILEGEEFTPLTAIHSGQVVFPITLYYNKDYNLLILQSLTDVTGKEWIIVEAINKLAKDLQVKEIITIDGTPTKEEKEEVFYYSLKGEIKGLKQFDDGIIMGVTAALLLKKTTPVTSLFAEVHSNLPDSEAAAHVIQALDKYLGLKIDYAPLLEAARKFEENLRGYMENVQNAQDTKSNLLKKQFNYIG